MRARATNAWSAWSEHTRDRASARRPVARIAFDTLPQSGPWGGGNAWLTQQVRQLRRRGYSVRFDLRERVDCIVLASAKPTHLQAITLDEVRTYRRRNPRCVCVQRVNDSDRHRASSEVDDHLARASDVVDHTVFISSWVRDYHASRWFDARRSHEVVLNGADPTVFHPIGSATFDGRQPLRLVTHHWSANRAKGFDRYAELDALIADGALPDTELWVIGRWPESVRWRAARLVGPHHGRELAALLRACHVYVTASRWEAGGMHVVEGLQCGLPVLFDADGGGIAEVATVAGLPCDGDLASAVQRARAGYADLRARALRSPPSGDRMCLAYTDAIQRLLATARLDA